MGPGAGGSPDAALTFRIVLVPQCERHRLGGRLASRTLGRLMACRRLIEANGPLHWGSDS